MQEASKFALSEFRDIQYASVFGTGNLGPAGQPANPSINFELRRVRQPGKAIGIDQPTDGQPANQYNGFAEARCQPPASQSCPQDEAWLGQPVSQLQSLEARLPATAFDMG